jgi:hypothetical protein
MNTVLQFLYPTDGKIDACVDYTRPSLTIGIVILKKAFLDAKKRGVKLRYAMLLKLPKITSHIASR